MTAHNERSRRTLLAGAGATIVGIGLAGCGGPGGDENESGNGGVEEGAGAGEEEAEGVEEDAEEVEGDEGEVEDENETASV